MAFKFNIFTGKFDTVLGDSDNVFLPTRVETFADLPPAASHTGELFAVNTSTGIIFINRNKSGLYKSDGTNWNYFTSFTASQIPYSNIDSTLVAADVKSAIDELDNEVSTALQNTDSASLSNLAINDRLNLGATRNSDTINGPDFINGAVIVERYNDSNAIISGMSDVSYTEGDVFNYTNQSDADVTFLHQGASTGQPFDFADEQDVIISSGDAISFYYSNGSWRMKSLSRLRLDEDKYTQAEVDALIENQVVIDLVGPSLYVAPDAGSAQPGDFIGGAGIRDAIREASKYMIQNPTSFINIYLRGGEYTLVAPIEIAHPQGKKVIRLRSTTLQNLATNQAINAALVMNDQVADDATLAANYSVIINCPSYAFFFDKGTGIESVNSIMFRYTGTNTSRAGVYCSQQGSATLSKCAFIGFPYGVRALEFSSVGVTTGGFFIYCSLTTLRAEEMSVIRVTQTANYKTTFHSTGSYTIYALTKAYIRVVAAATSRIKVYNDTTSRANFLATGMSTLSVTRCDIFGGDEGFSISQGSFLQAASCTVTGNAAFLARMGSQATAIFSTLTGDAAGTATQQTIDLTGNSFADTSGTFTNVIFNPDRNVVADSSRTTT